MLAACVAVGAVLVAVVDPPLRRTGWYAVRGKPVFRFTRGAVRGLEVALGAQRFAATRTDGGWRLDGRAPTPQTAAALDDLLTALLDLRPIAAFRAHGDAAFGLDRPRGTIEVVTGRGPRRLALGALTVDGASLYARRDGDPRVLQLGTALLSSLERVLYYRTAVERAGQRPETG